MGDPEKTAQTIDKDGWMHSGDIATLDEDEDPRIPSPRYTGVRVTVSVEHSERANTSHLTE